VSTETGEAVHLTPHEGPVRYLNQGTAWMPDSKGMYYTSDLGRDFLNTVCFDGLKKSGRADPQKIAVMGVSYGGFMTLACLTMYPEVWAAGVDIVGAANFITFLKNTGPYRREHRIAEYGDPEKDGDFLREISPSSHVDRNHPFKVRHR
jgi:dipeptidyl aminopeptidase/acylaminoacyl peptidase